MRDLSTLTFNKTSERLVEILCSKTQNPNPLFFRVLVAYYFAKIASMQRVNIMTLDRGLIPVNVYAINLASSGMGKGHSTNIVEEQVINQFRERFLEETFTEMANRNLAKLTTKRAIRNDSDEEDERIKVDKEFENLGKLAFSFDSGTSAAIKQMRQKLLMANAGSMNMEIDEIGSNLISNTEPLNVLLELYDVGKVKQKLTKNTAENVRSEEIDGRTPANCMMFGTPAKLFDGGKVEAELMSFIETGYGRRCFFGYSKDSVIPKTLTPMEILKARTNVAANTFLEDLSSKLGDLADISNFGKVISMKENVALLVIEYELHCKKRSEALGEHDEMKKAELSHRYFKALKLAGTYAFIEGSHEITEEHYYSAICLAEESGIAFEQMMSRDRNYVKIAKYLARTGREVTHVDLVEDLPCYKGSESVKRELMTLAIAWGYKNNIIIRRIFTDSIEFLKGESLKETDTDKMIFSCSSHQAFQYKNHVRKFEDLHKITQAKGFHWVNHHLIGGAIGKGHRKDDAIVAGFNMAVLDVDEGVSLATAQMLLKEYKYLIYTTKSHQGLKDGVQQGDRFRIMFPLSHELKMSTDEFKEFMGNIFEWIPFKCDEGTIDRCRKWESFNGQHFYNDGKLIDALNFIPQTAKNDERKKSITSQQSLSNMERWFISNTGTGNRSNQLIKYALMLVDSGMDEMSVESSVMNCNSKLQDKMDESEIASTIMRTVAKAITKRDM